LIIGADHIVHQGWVVANGNRATRLVGAPQPPRPKFEIVSVVPDPVGPRHPGQLPARLSALDARKPTLYVNANPICQRMHRLIDFLLLPVIEG
jgi:hypothetical protein